MYKLQPNAAALSTAGQAAELESLLKAATKSNSLSSESLKDKEPRGTYPASSCTHLLQESCLPCTERQGKRVMAKQVEEMRLPLSSLPM